MNRSRAGRIAVAIASAAIMLFLLVPLLVVIPISFNKGSAIHFPPRSWSTQWYREAISDDRWTSAAWTSTKLAIVVGTLSTVLAWGAAQVIATRTRGNNVLRFALIAPLTVPVIVTSAAAFDFYDRIGLRGTFLGLLLAHTVIAMPYAVIILESGFRRIDPTLAQAAATLGAGRRFALAHITLPLMAPYVIASVGFSALASWDDVVIVRFIGGVTMQTLPLRMFEYLETTIRPTIAAVSTILVASVLLAFLLGNVVAGTRRRTSSRRSSP